MSGCLKNTDIPPDIFHRDILVFKDLMVHGLDTMGTCCSQQVMVRVGSLQIFVVLTPVLPI